ncbi:MAG: hypothetical protein WAW37_19520 [Syntrophobacteraceae bacterium]
MAGIADPNDPKKDEPAEIPFDDYTRARREGAFISPCGTEGCQWDGFPEPPDDSESEKEPE